MCLCVCICVYICASMHSNGWAIFDKLTLPENGNKLQRKYLHRNLTNTFVLNLRTSTLRLLVLEKLLLNLLLRVLKHKKV